MKKKIIFLTLVFCVILYFILFYISQILFGDSITMSIVELITTIILTICVMDFFYDLIKHKKINYKCIFIFFVCLGIFLRSFYINYTPINIRQHDMETGVGHLAYIETIYETGKLPETNEWQFYQQPLHHIISAIWLKVNSFFGASIETSEEGIQILTAIYSTLIILITYKILEETETKDAYKIIVMSIICIHPSFIILSGSINNDILMTMFVFLDLLYLIKWYKNPGLINTILLALFVALGALTRIASTIIAIPIIYIFLIKFISAGKERWKKYFFKFLIFGIISLGIGLSFSIRNKIKFDQPIFYVPEAGPLTYCGDSSIIDRINIFSKEFTEVYCNPYKDCNVFAYLIKCSLFGEFNLNETEYIGRNDFVAKSLLVLNINLIIISIYSLIKILNRKNIDAIYNIFIIYYFTQIMMYAYGNIMMPFACTMDFRYIVPTIFLGMMFILKNVEDNENNNNYYKYIMSIVLLFSLFSVIFELFYLNTLIIA